MKAARRLGWFSLIIGCGGPATQALAGETCFRAKDCQPGLVCLQWRCSADLDPLVPEGAGTPIDAGAATGQ